MIAGLAVAEMVATRGVSLGAQLKALFAKVGSYFPVRENFHLTTEQKAAFTEKLRANPKELSGRKVVQVVRTDGLKLILDDGSWVCYRLSGTEPVVRAYTETRNERDMQALRSGLEVCAELRFGRGKSTDWKPMPEENMHVKAAPTGKKPVSLRTWALGWMQRLWRPAGTGVAVILALLVTWHVIYGNHGLLVYSCPATNPSARCHPPTPGPPPGASE